MSTAVIFLAIGAIGGITAILFAFRIWWQVRQLPTGNGKENQIFQYIRSGAIAYMKREAKTVLIIAAIIALIIAFTLGPWVAFAYINGTLTSLVASFIGFNVATKTNVRVTLAAKNGLLPGMRTAFKGGTVMGMLVFGINIVQFSVLFSLFHLVIGMDYNTVMVNIVGCAFGGSFTSVMLQLGGGIFTKAADISADIVGKIEKDIPEDDHRNPAVIADMVGDNVGDCAGRSADLYETMDSELISSMILGLAIVGLGSGIGLTDIIIFFPFFIRSIAVLATIIGYYFVIWTKKEGDTWLILNKGLYFSSAVIAVAYVLSVFFIFSSIYLMIAAILGVIANLLLGNLIHKYTGFNSKAVKEIGEAAETGPAPTLISGMANGMRAVVLPLLFIVILVLGAYGCGLIYGLNMGFPPELGNPVNVTAGIYGIAIMAMGITSGTGIILSMDGFGPISDNASGIAEMANVGPEVRKTLDKLDATGNSTKSLTKGFSIFSGAVIGFVTIFAYLELLRGAGLTVTINIGDPRIAVGGILGIITVFLFVSLLMRAVGKTAHEMIEEIRYQFRTRPGILADKELPDYARCVDISTISALKKMIFPGLLVIAMPIVVGLILGPFTAGAYLIAATFAAGGFGFFLNISGASMDNAKKFRKLLRDDSKPETIEAYKASIIGDTVGDPMKDTAGSSLGSFITTINNMALTFFPLFVNFSLIFLIFGIH